MSDDEIRIGSNAAADLKDRVRAIAGLARVEAQLKARAKEVREQIKDAVKKADSAGHDTVILKKVVAEALLSLDERLERYDNEERVDALLEATREALGLRDEDDALGIAEEGDGRAKAHADLLAGNDVHTDRPVMDRRP